MNDLATEIRNYLTSNGGATYKEIEREFVNNRGVCEYIFSGTWGVMGGLAVENVGDDDCWKSFFTVPEAA
jgi:hypothetical protein